MRRGFVLGVVIIVGFVVSVIAFSYFFSTKGEALVSEKFFFKVKSFYIAEAGVNTAISYVKLGDYRERFSEKGIGWSFKVKIKKCGFKIYDFSSVGGYGGEIFKIHARRLILPESISFKRKLKIWRDFYFYYFLNKKPEAESLNVKNFRKLKLYLKKWKRSRLKIIPSFKIFTLSRYIKISPDDDNSETFLTEAFQDL